MVRVEDAVIARIKVPDPVKKSHSGEVFEILVDPELALEFRSGKSVSLRDVLAVDRIFSDARKGTEASGQKLKQFFNTSNADEVATQILKKGDVPVTAKQKEKQREQKRNQIIALIHRNAVDPKTKLPHPPQRIEAAMEQAKVKIDENKDAQSQIQDIVRRLQPIIPIKFEIDQIEVKMPGKFGAKHLPVIKQFGTVLREKWLDDGSWQCVVELPAGLKNDFFDRLNSLTHGDVETKIISTR